jgi:hypothetical protein
MGDSINISIFLCQRTLRQEVGVLEKVLDKISRVYRPEEYLKLIEQSSRQGKFSESVCDNNFSTEHKPW